jgi:hypothetical protein
LPKARLVGLAVSVPCVTPVPERGMLRFGFDAVEVMLTLPLAAPPVVGLNTTDNEMLCPPVKVTGKASPLKLYPVPLALAAEMVRLDPPVLVSVSDKLVLLLTWTLPNARAVGLAPSAPGVTPVPESGMLKLGFEPFEVTLTLPLAAPLAVGEKSTVNDVLWPAVNVRGRDRPLRLNPVPLAVAAEMVRLEPPVLVSVSLNDFDVLICTLLKARVLGFGTKSPCGVPVPESETDSAGLLALELIVRLPLAAPATVGAKDALKVVLCPALSVIGRVGPVKPNPLPVAAALDTATLSPPVFVTVMGTV